MTMDKTFTRYGDIVANAPNWASPVTEEFAYLTTIFEAFDGAEKRDALRQTPRITVQYVSDVVDGAGRRLFYDLNRREDTGLFILPVRWRRTTLATEALFDDLVIQIVGDRPWWLYAGSVLVLESSGTQEAVTVESVSGSDITLAEGLQSSFALGSAVMLAHSVRYDTSNVLTSETDRHRKTLSRFAVDPASTPAWPTEVDASVVHEGYPVFIPDPNWRAGVETSVEGQWDVMDTSRGIIDVSRSRSSSLFDFRMSFTKMNQTAVDKLIGFFMTHMGRRGNFWVPAALEEMRMVGTQARYSETLTLEGVELHRAFFDSDTATTVMVRFPDGCLQFNRIESMELDGNGDTVVTLADYWEQEVLPEYYCTFSFLCRFMDDALEVSWVTSEAAEMSLGFRPTPNLWVRDEIITQTFAPWPRIYSNTSNDPIASPDNWLKIDLAATGIPLAAVDRGEVTLGHMQSMVGGGLLPAISVDGHVRFHDEDNIRIDTDISTYPQFGFNGDSGDPATGSETTTTAQYTVAPKRIPPYSIYADDGEVGFARAVRYIYLRGNFIVHPIFGAVESSEYEVVVGHPSWGQYEQEGNTACPES